MRICIVVISKLLYKSLFEKFKDCKYDVVFITDLPINQKINNIIYYDNKECDKRFFMGSGINRGRGWDKCIRYLVENNNYDYYWILEDDVFFRDLSFIEDYQDNNSDFIYPKNIKSYNTQWRHFNNNTLKFFKKDSIKGSTSYICRLSKNVVKKIDLFKNHFKKLVFHEVLFPSLCCVFKLTTFKMLNKHSKYLNTTNINNDDLLKIFINKDVIVYHPFKQWYKINLQFHPFYNTYQSYNK